MRWIAKAAVQKVLGALPNEEAVNYLFQRHLTRTLPRRGSNLDLHIELPARHLKMFERHSEVSVGDASFFEFGAGWDLIGPLTYYALGVNAQTLIDIRPNLRFELVEQAWADLKQKSEKIEDAAGSPPRDLGTAPPDSEQALERFGISYKAPCDARDTGLPADSFDFISSTDTIEHIPRPDLEQIFVELARILRPNGLISCTIDLCDIYSYFDPNISQYNYLRYSDRAWSLANSGLHYQSRLRISDYCEIIEAAGLKIVERLVEEPTPEDLAELRSMKLAPRFQDGYSEQDLGATSALLVAQPG